MLPGRRWSIWPNSLLPSGTEPSSRHKPGCEWVREGSARAYFLPALLLPSCGRGVRNDSLTIAIVMAAARTTRPASCPPIRRGFNGSVFEAEIALIRRECLLLLVAPLAAGLAVGCGDTVGNRPDGLVPVPGLGTAGTAGTAGIVGSGGSGGSGLVLGGGVVVEGAGFGAATIWTEPTVLKDEAALAVAFAMRVKWSPGLASFRTATRACSSSACPCGRSPSAQVAPLAAGQTENRAAPVPLT